MKHEIKSKVRSWLHILLKTLEWRNGETGPVYVIYQRYCNMRSPDDFRTSDDSYDLLLGFLGLNLDRLTYEMVVSSPED